MAKCSRVPFPTALLLATALAGCEGAPEPGDASVNQSNAAGGDQRTLRLPDALPKPQPELDRAALLAAVARAASAHAAGTADTALQGELDGRRFTLKLRFGCGGPSQAGALRWSYDEDEQALTVAATPDIDTDSPLFAQPGADGPIEAVEGFWIPRPWILGDACPAGGEGEAAAPPARRSSVGIAQYFTAEDSRVQRRSGRAYQIVRRAEPAIAPSGEGFTLVLHGRLRRWPEGNAIRCAGPTGERPTCIISAELDRVAFENPETGLTIAEWSGG